MILNFFENLLKSLEELMEGPAEFFYTHYQNPIMWLAFFLTGLVIFNATYDALEKDR